jgi:hypothetical protein
MGNQALCGGYGNRILWDRILRLGTESWEGILYRILYRILWDRILSLGTEFMAFIGLGTESGGGTESGHLYR